MVVDAFSGGMVTQRNVPRMCRIRVRLDGEQLLVGWGDGHWVPTQSTGNLRQVEVWGDVLPGEDMGEEVAVWLSHALRQPVRLVRLPPQHGRTADRRFAPALTPVGFADGFPVLVVSTGSLAALSDRVGRRVAAVRFRPNLLVDGPDGFEGQVASFTAGSSRFTWVKPCGRCSVPTVDPATGQREGADLLKALAAYRRLPDGEVWFGGNFICTAGEVAVGDALRDVVMR